MSKLKEDFEASGGVWKEWKMGDLFVSSNGNFDIQQTHINGKGDYVVSSGEQNNGIIGKTDVVASVFDKNTITVDMFGNVFFRDFRYKMVTHARVFSLKFISEKFTEKSAKYVTSNLYFLKESFSYSNMASWNKIADKMVKLPTFKGEPSYSFMEQYISLLEEEKMLQVDKFLKDSGLNDTTLTAEETAALEKFRNGEVKFEERKIGELFTLKAIKQAKSQSLIPEDSNGVPYIVQSTKNNMYKMHVNEKWLIDNDESPVEGNAIVLGVTLPAVSYQPYKFGASQVIVARADFLQEQIGLFIVPMLEKLMIQFSYSKKPGMQIYKNMFLSFPINASNEIDYTFMQHFISAQEKLIIKGVVKYKDEVLNS
ncbi:MAG: restriction endonuclease subunit S [Paludibacteraceae bacterium]|nr:restriction endonuclease subunit S [Paludibacteraceae bacterium]